MTDIETKIREQKNKIKEDQRELSKLQDKARQKDEPLKIDSVSMETVGELNQSGLFGHLITVYANKKLDYMKVREAIESIPRRQDKPNWNEKGCLDWACRDYDGKWHYAASKEALITCDQATLVHREPKSYVNWDKIVKTNGWPIANYVFVDKDGDVLASAIKPCNGINISCGWETSVPLWDVRQEWPDAITGPLPSWDKSLIHRPGIKE